jgi:hypothetical protein
MRTETYSTILICLVLSVTQAQAEPYSSSSASKTIGRGADGSAYRIDRAGNEIVDHLAELELQNADLENQVRGLEEDLRYKESLINQLKGQKEKASPPKPIIPSSQNLNYSINNEKIRALGIKLKKIEKELAASKESNLQLKERVANLKDIIGRKDSIAQAYSLTLKDKISLQDKLELQDRVIATRGEELQKALRKQRTEFERQLNTAKLNAKNTELTLKKQLAALQNKKTIAKKSITDYSDIKARYQPTILRNSNKILPTQPRQNVSQQREQVDRLINDIDKNIYKRKLLYENYLKNNTNPAISITLDDPISKSGVTLSLIKSKIKLGIQIASEYSLVLRDLNEMRVSLEEDLGLISRLGNGDNSR